tara:strand:- start:496 stop:597 length:102 start_codon:yes stop_codon:yes gene_type:complete
MRPSGGRDPGSNPGGAIQNLLKHKNSNKFHDQR